MLDILNSNLDCYIELHYDSGECSACMQTEYTAIIPVIFNGSLNKGWDE